MAKALAITSQMTDAVLNDADARENGTSPNHKKVIQMGIHATTLLSHIQAEMSQQRRNNISIVELQYVSLCGPKPGSKAAMQKPKNTDSEHLLGDDLEKAAKKAKMFNNMFKKLTNSHSNSNHSKFKFISSISQSQDFLYYGHKVSSNNQKNRRFTNQNSHPNYQTKNQDVPKTRK